MRIIRACGEQTTGKLVSSGSPIRSDGWLCELTLQEGPDVDIQELRQTRSPARASEKGLLPVRLDEYLQLLDWAGRVVRADKQGAIPAHLAPILERVGITMSLWTDLVTQFDRLFGRVVGRADRVAVRSANERVFAERKAT